GQSSTTLEKIKQVENGLSNYHQIKGEPTWTIAERMNHYGVPGMSIAVIHDYKVAWTKTYGVTDKTTKEPVTENTLFQAASISKPIAAYAALSMVEDGQLALEQNINDFLKAWQVPDNELTTKEKVTLKRLVSHKAGLTVHGFLGYSPDLPVPTLVQLLDGKTPANSAPIRVDKTPGGASRYSGGGYCVLQQAMIDVAGKTFPEIMQERVLAPLGMNKSTYTQPLPADQLKLAATGYVPDGSMTKGKRHTYPEMAAAGLWTNAEELAKFVIDLQQTLKGDSEKVLSKEMAKKMVTPVEGDFQGLGIFLGDGRFGHGGWNEGFSSNMGGHLTDGSGLIVMINANQPPLIEEVTNAVARVYNWPSAAPQPHEKLVFTKAEIARISGKYAYEFDNNITVYAENGKVYLKYLLGGTPQELIKIADNTYVRRDKEAIIQFLSSPFNNQPSLVFLPKKAGDELAYKNVKVIDNKKLGVEWLMEGNVEEALTIYKKRLEETPNFRRVHEDYLNTAGYQMLGDGQIDLAINIFKLNVALYPYAYKTFCNF
ncbi:MAG: serine hydrolase domain-containing protein, partial [Bacteroidota bacterium]